MTATEQGVVLVIRSVDSNYSKNGPRFRPHSWATHDHARSRPLPSRTSPGVERESRFGLHEHTKHPSPLWSLFRHRPENRGEHLDRPRISTKRLQPALIVNPTDPIARNKGSRNPGAYSAVEEPAAARKPVASRCPLSDRPIHPRRR